MKVLIIKVKIDIQGLEKTQQVCSLKHSFESMSFLTKLESGSLVCLLWYSIRAHITITVCLMVFNATFNNISVISWHCYTNLDV
jgi:hypothetical protein